MTTGVPISSTVHDSIIESFLTLPVVVPWVAPVYVLFRIYVHRGLVPVAIAAFPDVADGFEVVVHAEVVGAFGTSSSHDCS